MKSLKLLSVFWRYSLISYFRGKKSNIVVKHSMLSFATTYLRQVNLCDTALLFPT